MAAMIIGTICWRKKGIIVVCVDGRGTGFKGSDFKKSTYLNLVKYETEDQIAAAKKLAERSYIDAENIGIWGWSFGGHMSTNSLLKGNDIFTTSNRCCSSNFMAFLRYGVYRTFLENSTREPWRI
jgi:dipeptidyl aminopeptidase/acylaminoacyl peptidase